MKLIIKYRDGRVDYHSTEEFVQKEPFDVPTLCTTFKLHTEDLKHGLWVEVWYHDMKHTLLIDAPAANEEEWSDEQWEVARPTFSMRINIVEERNIKDVAQIMINDDIIAEIRGTEYPINLLAYNVARATFLGNTDSPDFITAANTYYALADAMELDYEAPEDKERIAAAMGWQASDIDKALKYEAEHGAEPSAAVQLEYIGE